VPRARGRRPYRTAFESRTGCGGGPMEVTSSSRIPKPPRRDPGNGCRPAGCAGRPARRPHTACTAACSRCWSDSPCMWPLRVMTAPPFRNMPLALTLRLVASAGLLAEENLLPGTIQSSIETGSAPHARTRAPQVLSGKNLQGSRSSASPNRRLTPWGPRNAPPGQPFRVGSVFA
jgi:hypothetical protein